MYNDDRWIDRALDRVMPYFLLGLIGVATAFLLFGLSILTLQILKVCS